MKCLWSHLQWKKTWLRLDMNRWFSVSQCFMVCDVSLPHLQAAVITAAVYSCILCQPGYRRLVCVCVCVCVRACVEAGGVWCLTYWTWRRQTALHTLACKCTNVPGCWISPHLMISMWSRFLQTQTHTYTHTHTHRHRPVAPAQPLSVSRIYCLDCRVQSACSQWHLKRES